MIVIHYSTDENLRDLFGRRLNIAFWINNECREWNNNWKEEWYIFS
jgi:hypothetical protein